MTGSDGGSAPGFTPEPEGSRVWVNGWSIETDSGEARKGARQVRLQPRPLAVLLYLLRHRGRVIPREELLATVWDGRFVTQDVVWRAISHLRRCLSDADGPSASLIETLPGRGYRIPQARAPVPAAEASRAAPPSPTAIPAAADARPRRRPYLLAAGLSALAVTALVWTGAPRLDHRGGARADGEVTPADTAVQAREHYQRGLEYYKRLGLVDVERSIAAYTRALELDPDLVEARAALASSYCLRGLYRYDQADLELAMATAEGAVDADPTLPAAHKAMALAYRAQGKNRQSLAASRRAVELDPSYPEGAHNVGANLNRLGRPDAAVAWHRRAIALEPRQVVFVKGLGDAFYLMGSWAEARRWYAEALAREPFHDLTTAVLAKIDLMEGDVGVARDRLAQALEVHPRSPELLLMAALVEQVNGREDEARELAARSRRATAGRDAETYLRQLSLAAAADREEQLESFVGVGRAAIEGGDEDWGTPFLMAGAEALRGRDAEALDLLSAAVAAGFLDYRLVQIDPIFANLRGNPRFVALMDALARRASTMRRAASVPAEPSIPRQLADLGPLRFQG